MSYAGNRWVDEYEQIGRDYSCGITREEAERRMKALGLDPEEIKTQLDELEK